MLNTLWESSDAHFRFHSVSSPRHEPSHVFLHGIYVYAYNHVNASYIDYINY